MKTPRPQFAPSGHTTGVEEESDQVAAIPLVERCRRRRTNGRGERKRNGRSRRFRQKLNYNCSRKLPIRPGNAARRSRWRLFRVGIILGRAAGSLLARTAMAAALGSARLLVGEIGRPGERGSLRHYQRNAEYDGKQTSHDHHSSFSTARVNPLSKVHSLFKPGTKYLIFSSDSL